MNPSQLEAVTHKEGPLLVIAGAGTGKTQVITRRVAYLVREGVSPWNVIAVTFTNKAAEEMKTRLEALGVPNHIWVSTFHSMCARMLRQFSDLVGYRGDFTIYDADDQKRLIKELLSRYPEVEVEDVGSVRASISALKNELVSPEDARRRARDDSAHQIARLYGVYQRTLRKLNAMDFDDLLFYVAQLLAKHDRFRQYWSGRFRYILVDEYQDTNHAQYMIGKALAEEHRNICVTGDPDQSIYGWRGANIRNILEFEYDFPEAKVVKLEKNYRSTPLILRAASELIRHNKLRKERTLYAEREGSIPIELWEFEDDEQENQAVGQEILRLVREEGYRLSQIAVFFRTNAQSRILELSFRTLAVPYVVVGTVGFYERKEIKDIVSYLRLLVNESDDISLERILNVPPRGIGDVTMREVKAWAEKHSASLFESVRNSEKIERLTPRAKGALREFCSLINGLRRLRDGSIEKLVREVLVRSGYLKMMEDSKDSAKQERIENLEELVRSARLYDERNPEGGLRGFLEEASLLTSIDSYDDTQDVTPLMTLHSAKGLEFRAVFITGLVEGLLPHHTSFYSREELEEERRLCYVGITRAKERVYLTYPCCRSGWSAGTFCERSRFITEIPPECLVERRLEVKEPYTRGEREFSSSGERKRDKDAGNDGNFRPGDLVYHETFGRGRVVGVGGVGESRRVSVRFDGGSDVHLMLKYTPLRKL